MSSAAEITRKAKSNLALAFVFLPKDRKRDMVSFYAFCRVIDDLSDDLKTPLNKKIEGLNEWHDGLEYGFKNPDEIQSEITNLITRYKIPKQLFLDIISGCASDLYPQRFNTWEDLQNYTYRVASCVGIVSTRIFGCKHPNSEQYAITLGHALQLTNILRDIAEDLNNGKRIYLPLDDFIRFEYSERDLIKRVYDDRFIAMMNYQADRAEKLYTKATKLIPADDRQALKAAEAMRKIYQGVLKKMKDDNFQVFTHRYSLSKGKKIVLLLSSLF